MQRKMDLKYNTLNHSLYESLPPHTDILRSLILVPGHGLNKYGAAISHSRYTVPKQDVESPSSCMQGQCQNLLC